MLFHTAAALHWNLCTFQNHKNWGQHTQKSTLEDKDESLTKRKKNKKKTPPQKITTTNTCRPAFHFLIFPLLFNIDFWSSHSCFAQPTWKTGGRISHCEEWKEFCFEATECFNLSTSAALLGSYTGQSYSYCTTVIRQNLIQDISSYSGQHLRSGIWSNKLIGTIPFHCSSH